MITEFSDYGRDVVGYARVSTAQQVTNKSLSRQQRDIQAGAELLGSNELRIYVEEGQSAKAGTLKTRRELQKALSDVCECRGLLMVRNFHRLTRSKKDARMLIDQINEAGCKIIATTNELSGLIFGDWAFEQLAGLNEWRLKQLAEQTTKAAAVKKMQGKRWGRISYGFELADDGARLVLSESEQRILNLILDEHSKKESFGSIARLLNSWRVPAKGGGMWYSQTVKNAIQFYVRWKADS